MRFRSSGFLRADGIDSVGLSAPRDGELSESGKRRDERSVCMAMLSFSDNYDFPATCELFLFLFNWPYMFFTDSLNIYICNGPFNFIYLFWHLFFLLF